LGILFRNGEALQSLLSVNVGASEHPLAEVRGAEERGVPMVEAGDFEAVTGKGVKGVVDGRPVVLGNLWLVTEMGLSGEAPVAKVDARREQGETVMFVVLDGAVAGLVGVANPVKETTPAALKALHEQGCASSWRQATAPAPRRRWPRGLASTRSVPTCCPKTRPASSASCRRPGTARRWPGTGRTTPPALAQTDVGIAMGTGADVAMEGAGFTLVKGNLDGIVRARKLSRATMRNIRQNLFFALIYNAAGVPVAAGLLYPFTGILIGPIFAAFAMSASSLSVVLNALHLRRAQI
jgi:Cu+-exporting ATPase